MSSSLTSSSRVWAIYDALLADLPADVRTDAFSAGLHWFGVRADGGVGLAMAPSDGRASPTDAGSISGRTVRELALRARSWNMADAALGLASINAWHNRPDRVSAWTDSPDYLVHEGCNTFETMLPRVKGRKVAVIGHFRGLENLAEVCDLAILERSPQAGDLPDPACEVVLPECEVVFITGTTLINKTLPRLLELSRNAFVCLVGPTTPISPRVFDFGVDLVAGLLVDRPDEVWPVVLEGGQHRFFDHGTRMIQIECAASRKTTTTY